MSSKDLEDKIRDLAVSDGQYAIAYALLQVAAAQNEIALALDMIGTNRAGRANFAMGALEFIGKQLEEINDNLGNS
jgi:O-acetylhomoserine/O-acetylserine sulfhydrylase-like pyridoxal-dependent enzyme